MEELYLEAYNRSPAANTFTIRRRANRKGFTISHRAFQHCGQINRGLWWFGDKEFRLVSPVKGLSDQEAIEWLDTKV